MRDEDKAEQKKRRKRGEEVAKRSPSNLKITDEGVVAVDDFNLEIADKEFIVIVGPSGCGKSTTMRMVAGLEDITRGEIYLNGRLINDVEPRDRDIAMVFQNYALYPHMTVRQNLEFPLDLRNMPKDEMDRKVEWAAEILGITPYLKRRPRALSGGQRQRVAIGRAIVRDPQVLLMDEPLSNLDAKLRVTMRTTIKKLQRRLGITTVYVTHDQEEALAISDRIAVMDHGNIMQVGTPEEIYRKPANPFVANFIGVSNFIDCPVQSQGGTGTVSLPGGYSLRIPVRRNYSGDAILSARPEQLFFGEEGIPGRITLSVFLGDFIQYEVELVTGQVIELNEYTKDVDAIRPDGEEVRISMQADKVSLYEKESREVLSC